MSPGVEQLEPNVGNGETHPMLWYQRPDDVEVTHGRLNCRAWDILSASLLDHLLRRSPERLQGPGHLAVPDCWEASQGGQGKLNRVKRWKAHTSDIKEQQNNLCEMEVLSIGVCSEACPLIETAGATTNKNKQWQKPLTKLRLFNDSY